jgi:hypothetical protein
MHQYNVGEPFERITIDVAGPFPLSDQRNRYLLVAMDYFTKWSEAYRTSIRDTTGLTPARLVFGRELRLPYDLLFGAPPDKERPTTDHAADLVDHLHDIHNYARQHLKLASDRMETRYDKLANTAGYQEGGQSEGLSLNPQEREITKTSIIVERPIQNSNPDK